jgi:hypothetical protein
MKKYILNAFSLQMMQDIATARHTFHTEPISEEEVPKEEATSAVGHPDTARILGVEYNRTNVQLNAGDEAYVAQVIGGRLPEGCTELPEGIKIVWVKVTIE